MTAASPTRPTHRAFVVIKKGHAEKGRWFEIGAAGPHKDGQGYKVTLDLMPPAGAEIVIREIREGDRDAPAS
jgi:hypothetical protein